MGSTRKAGGEIVVGARHFLGGIDYVRKGEIVTRCERLVEGVLRELGPEHRIMILIRLAKIATIAALAAYAFIVAYDNIVDYGSNYEFVKHVLSMDTTFPDNALKHRAISNESIWRAAYALIIAMEWLIAVLLVIGTFALLKRVKAPPEVFNRAKMWTIVGLTVGFGLWFFGFMVIAGEYFAMWQSKVWNAQESAFRVVAVILGVLVFVSLPDGDLT